LYNTIYRLYTGTCDLMGDGHCISSNKIYYMKDMSSKDTTGVT